MSSNSTATARRESGYHGWHFMIYIWSLFVITTTFVCIRLWVQLTLKSRPWRELLLIGAWLMYVTVTICDQIKASFGANEYVDKDYEHDPHAVALLKVTFVRLMLYKPVVYLCKALLLCLYMDLAPRKRNPWIWSNIVVAWFFVALGFLFQIFYAFLACQPLHAFWDINLYTCSLQYVPYLFSWVLFMFNDLQVYIIPFFILQTIRSLTLRQKQAAYWMFAAGFVNIGSAAFQLAVYAIPAGGWLLSGSAQKGLFNGNIFMGPFQLATAIIIVCLPQARRLCLGTSGEQMRRQLEEQLRGVAKSEYGADQSRATSFGVFDPEGGTHGAALLPNTDGMSPAPRPWI